MTPRSQGLLIESMALQVACAASDPDLLARAGALHDKVIADASSPGSTWRLYMPSWLGGYQSEADSIADDYKTRHGVNPLDVDAPAPTGALAQLGALASGNVGDAASAGSDVVLTDLGDALPDLGVATHVFRYGVVLLVLLAVLFVVLRARR